MQDIMYSATEALLLVLALSLDAFVSSFAYGSNKIKIPFRSVQVINLVCAFILGVSLMAGVLLKPLIPQWITLWISFGILFILGLIRLMDSITKSIIRKYSQFNKALAFSIFNIKFILNLYADPEKADVDESKELSPREAFSLGIALSLDSMAVGFGAALGEINIALVFLSSLLVTCLAIIFGSTLGNRLAASFACNISWLSGIILIALAFLKLM